MNVLSKGKTMVHRQEHKRILLLVESADYRKVIQLGLTMTSDWEVVSSHSLSEGLAVAEKKEFDAILLNGDCLEEDLPILLTHQSTRKLPVIALVAGKSAEWDFFIPQGVAAVIPKASHPLNLAVRIASALDWQIPSIN